MFAALSATSTCDLYCIKQSAYGDRINWLLYRGRVDFRDGGKAVIHCYTEAGLTSGMEGRR